MQMCGAFGADFHPMPVRGASRKSLLQILTVVSVQSSRQSGFQARYPMQDPRNTPEKPHLWPRLPANGHDSAAPSARPAKANLLKCPAKMFNRIRDLSLAVHGLPASDSSRIGSPLAMYREGPVPAPENYILPKNLTSATPEDYRPHSPIKFHGLSSVSNRQLFPKRLTCC